VARPGAADLVRDADGQDRLVRDAREELVLQGRFEVAETARRPIARGVDSLELLVQLQPEAGEDTLGEPQAE
jgi:hypothetical protein